MQRTIAEILAKGRPASGYGVTHDYTVRSLADCRGQLAYGLLRDGHVHREYSWRRPTGNVRLETGAARQKFGDAPGRTIPAVLAVALDSFAGLAGGKCEGKDGTALVDAIARLPFSDVALLALDRAIERNRGAVPLVDGSRCMACGQGLGEIQVTREAVRVACLDWRPEAPPLAVCWLDEPFRYGEEEAVALIAQAVSWHELYSGATMADLQNREWTTVRSAASCVVGFITADGSHRPAAIARSIIAERCLDSDVTRLSEAAFACSGGAQMGAFVEHECGVPTLVPFAWQAGA